MNKTRSMFLYSIKKKSLAGCGLVSTIFTSNTEMSGKAFFLSHVEYTCIGMES